jgi:hypothetical protein
MHVTTVVILVVGVIASLCPNFLEAFGGADGATTSANAVTGTLLAAKKTKGLSWEEIGKTLGLSETWVASLFYRQATVPPTTTKIVPGPRKTSN